MRSRLVAVVGSALVCAGCVLPNAGLAPDLELAERFPGLVPIRSPDFDLALLRPEAALGSYDAVMLDPVHIEYYDRPSEHTRTPRSDTTASIAAELREIFERELGRDGGYAVVDQRGPGVLGARLWLVDVELDQESAMLSKRPELDVDESYMAEMTLVVELRDSESELVLFWARDRRPAPLGLRGSDAASLAGRVRFLGERWAEALRAGLGGPPKPGAGAPATP